MTIPYCPRPSRKSYSSSDALGRFIQFLHDDVQRRAVGEFAIGEAPLRAMLRAGEMIDLSTERLLEIGRDDLARNQALLSAAAARVDPHRQARDVMARLAQDHRTAEQLIPEAERLLEALRVFVHAEGLVSCRRRHGVGWRRRRPLRVGRSP